MTVKEAKKRIIKWLNEEAFWHTFYFSGHGSKGGKGICFSDGILSYDWIGTTFESKKVKFIIIIDACYSSNIILEFEKKYAHTLAFCLYCSSRDYQISFDCGSDGGYFTSEYFCDQDTFYQYAMTRDSDLPECVHTDKNGKEQVQSPQKFMSYPYYEIYKKM